MSENHEDLKYILDNLIIERKKQGITQNKLAEMTGMQAPNIALLETGKRIPTLKTLERYAEAVGKHISLKLEDK